MRTSILLSALVLAIGSATLRAEPAPPPAAPNRPLTVVCFGDSITGHRPHEPHLDKFLKWSDLLQLMIEAHVGPHRAVVLNRGWSGDTTYEKKSQGMPGAVARLKTDVLDARPDIAVVLLSGNDKKDTEADRQLTRSNLDRIVADLKAARVRVLMLQYHVLPNPNTPEKTWHHLARNNDLIAEVAKAHEVPVLAMQPAFDEAARTQPQPELCNVVDGVHLAPGGEMVYARAVFFRLLALGWLSPSDPVPAAAR